MENTAAPPVASPFFMPIKLAKQRGSLWLPALLLTALISTSLLWLPTAAPDRTAQALAQAKIALLARAALDDNRPGSLPCPDLLTNQAALNNLPDDGRADTLTRNDCPTYVGRLPWATLDLGDLRDSQGERLWYALSKNFRDDDSAQPIQSDTPGSLQVDQTQDVAAILFSPGPLLANQKRPSLMVSDYLEAENGTNSTYFSSQAGNDRLIFITRQQLMEVAQTRVLRELLACMKTHARQTGRYPWPAQWNDNAAHGSHGNLFGKPPLTQPQGSLNPALNHFSSTLATLRQMLSTSPALNEVRQSLADFQDKLVAHMNQQAALYQASNDLYQQSNPLSQQLDTLAVHLKSAMANGRISNSERTTFRTDQGIVDPALSDLLTTLLSNGLDAFPDQLSQLQQQILQAKQTGNNDTLNSSLNALQSLLAQTESNNTALNSLIDTLSQNSSDWQNALPLYAAGDSRLTQRETGWLNAQENLQAALSSLRFPIPAENFAWYGKSLTEATDLITQQAYLNVALSDLAQLAPHPNLEAFTQSLSALQQTLQNAVDKKILLSLSEKRLLNNSLIAFTELMQQQGSNLTYSSLNSAMTQWRLNANELLTVSTKTQADLLPYAQRSYDRTVNLLFWVKILRDNNLQLATLTRQSPLKTSANTDSTYQNSLATQTLLKQSLSALDQAIASPSNSRLQTTARNSLQTLDSQLGVLLKAEESQQAHLFSGPASAFPMAWAGAACQAFQYISGQTSWWFANEWARTSFYQISAPETATPGKLTVNGQGNYQVLSINSGPALKQQQRPATQRSDYFEGNHVTATNAWEKRPVSQDFNDQIVF